MVVWWEYDGGSGNVMYTYNKYMYIKSDFTLRVYILIFCDVSVFFFFLVAVLGSFLESPHAVVPIISPLDHNRSLREYQSVASFAVILPAENQVKPIYGTKRIINIDPTQ